MPQPETENTILIGTQWENLYRDRYAYERATLIEEAVRAWRLNPLARRLANLFKFYNIDGIDFTCDHEPTHKFLTRFWNHDMNQIPEMLEEISNEIFLTGNLFPMFSVDATGMTYIRIFPADQIDQIVTTDNDIKQEIAYITKEMKGAGQKTFANLRGLRPARTFQFMEHFAVNKLAGTCWGEGEIWPDLPWLGRYATWLSDRTRLNHYRTSYNYVVKGKYSSKAEKESRQRELNANPPIQGSVLVTDESEQWEIIAPKLDSFDASVDGMAIKKMIAVNHVPLHYLAEPESSTRTTADAAGSPTFKGFENHQDTFKRILQRMLTIVVKRRAEKDSDINADAKITILSGDTTERDNAGLALATGQIVQSIGDMYDRKLIDEDEYLRLVYRFAGETRDTSKPIPTGIRKPLDSKGGSRPAPAGIKTNTQTGNTTTP